MLDILLKTPIMFTMHPIPTCFIAKKGSKKANRHPCVVW